MAEETATGASNDFWLEFKASRQAIDDQLQRSKTLPPSDLPVHFNSTLQEINNLEKKLTKATAFIPSYDERQFSLQIKELTEILELTRTDLTPKAKFSFKSRKKKAPATTAPVPVTTQLPKEESDVLSDATVHFTDKSNTVLTLKDSTKARSSGKSVDILLSNIKHSVIILQEKDVHISAIHIKNVDHCLIYCGSIEGSILMYGLTNSVLIAGCHQLRMHDAHHVDMLLHVTSRPIIEDSDTIQVGKYNGIGLVNYFDQIEDFNWLKKQASPNWKLMNQERYEKIENVMKSLDNANTDQDSLIELLEILTLE